jgi:glutathione S-transferase
MAPIKPVLVVFGISHFCEKARWALDWHGISYTEVTWPPGLHRPLLKKHGAKGSSLPVVLDGDLVV